MRDLTQNEINEYFHFARSQRKGGNFHTDDQIELIGQAVLDCGLLDAITPKITVGLASGMSAEAMLLGVFAAAFVMGRECESRLKKQPAWTQ